MPRRIIEFFLGKPLATKDLPHQTISKTVGLAVFASDALSSVAYATDEILLVLVAAGAAFFSFSLPIALAICAVLFILTISYRQTIFAYPNGGGAYVVARDNLGEYIAQVAGAALMTDYILTVSVSISSGVAQLASAFPFLFPWRVPLAVVMIGIMAWLNLRGVKESGRILAVPTYFFLITMFGTLAVGFFRFLQGSLPTVMGVEAQTGMLQAFTLFLLLRAFSSGAVALTGVEAISNGITAFKEPKSRNAAATMAWMSAILGTLFLGITFLALKMHAVPMEHETIISQIARTLYGTGMFHVLILAATTVILVLAANTSFAGFPRLAALQATDGFLPRYLAWRGSRLVFSAGIVALAGAAAVLVVVFQANVTHLIPLYAIGVFLSFTISQLGMVVRWRRSGRLRAGEVVRTKGSDLAHDPKWRLKQAVNGVGALVTFVVMVVLAVTKFALGAWIVVIAIPAMTWVFFRIHYHYKTVAEQLSLDQTPGHIPKEKTVIVFVSRVHQGTLKAVEFAKLLNPVHLRAVHIAIEAEEVDRIKTKWETYVPDVSLDVVESPFRDLIEPLITYIEQVDRQWPNDTVVVVMPEFIPTQPWHHLLHGGTARYLRDQLEHREDVVIVDVPYRLKDVGSPFSLEKAVHAVRGLWHDVMRVLRPHAK